MLVSRSTATPQERLAVLNCRRLPGRLNTSETAVVLGFQEHDIAPLVASRLLVPLGKPAKNAPKYFASADVVARSEDQHWLSQATKALANHWSLKNARHPSSQRSG